MTKSVVGMRLDIACAIIGCALSSIISATAQTAPDYPAASAVSSSSDTHIDTYRSTAAHTGYFAEQLQTPLSLVWRHTENAVSGSTASPTYVDRTVYFNSGSMVFAISAIDGATKWKYPTAAQENLQFETTPALSNGAVYVGAGDSQLYKLDAKTGAKLWTIKLGGPVHSTPIIVNNVVYFGCDDNHGYAVDAATGNILWAQPTDGPILASPVADNDYITFTCTDNSLYTVNPVTGRLAWRVKLVSDASVSPPLYADNMLYLGVGPYVYALASRNGVTRWRTRLSNDVSTPAAYANGMIYLVTQDQTVEALNNRGQYVWHRKIDYPTNAAPLLTNDTVIIPTQHGVIHAFNSFTGALKWQYVVTPAHTQEQQTLKYTDINSAPILADGTLYVQSDDGTINAFRSDAVDHIAPLVANTFPAQETTVGGVRIAYHAELLDMGSGIDPNSVTFLVDNAKVPGVIYSPSRKGIVVNPDESSDIVVPNLKDGPHTATVKASDWRGNAVVHSWSFTVDNKLSPVAAPLTPGNTAETPTNPQTDTTVPSQPIPDTNVPNSPPPGDMNTQQGNSGADANNPGGNNGGGDGNNGGGGNNGGDANPGGGLGGGVPPVMGGGGNGGGAGGSPPVGGGGGGTGGGGDQGGPPPPPI